VTSRWNAAQRERRSPSFACPYHARLAQIFFFRSFHAQFSLSALRTARTCVASLAFRPVEVHAPFLYTVLDLLCLTSSLLLLPKNIISPRRQLHLFQVRRTELQFFSGFSASMRGIRFQPSFVRWSAGTFSFLHFVVWCLRFSSFIRASTAPHWSGLIASWSRS